MTCCWSSQDVIFAKPDRLRPSYRNKHTQTTSIFSKLSTDDLLSATSSESTSCGWESSCSEPSVEIEEQPLVGRVPEDVIYLQKKTFCLHKSSSDVADFGGNDQHASQCDYETTKFSINALIPGGVLTSVTLYNRLLKELSKSDDDASILKMSSRSSEGADQFDAYSFSDENLLQVDTSPRLSDLVVLRNNSNDLLPSFGIPAAAFAPRLPDDQKLESHSDWPVGEKLPDFASEIHEITVISDPTAGQLENESSSATSSDSAKSLLSADFLQSPKSPDSSKSSKSSELLKSSKSPDSSKSSKSSDLVKSPKSPDRLKTPKSPDSSKSSKSSDLLGSPKSPESSKLSNGSSSPKSSPTSSSSSSSSHDSEAKRAIVEEPAVKAIELKSSTAPTDKVLQTGAANLEDLHAGEEWGGTFVGPSPGIGSDDMPPMRKVFDPKRSSRLEVKKHHFLDRFRSSGSSDQIAMNLSNSANLVTTMMTTKSVHFRSESTLHSDATSSSSDNLTRSIFR